MKKLGLLAAVLVALVSFASCDNVVRDPLKGNTFISDDDYIIEFGTDGTFTATFSEVVYGGTFSVNPVAHTFSATVTSFSCPDQDIVEGSFDTYEEYLRAVLEVTNPTATDEQIEYYVEYMGPWNDAYIAALANGDISPDNDAIGLSLDFDADGDEDDFNVFDLASLLQ